MLSRCVIRAKVMPQITLDSSDPHAGASPMGNRDAGKYFEDRYAPGTRTSRMDSTLCKNDSFDRPQAQKYPLKLK